MSSERSYPKPPGEGRPTPPNTETPTVDVAGELATARLGQKPAVQPEPEPTSAPAQAEPRPMWSMPTPSQAPAQTPAPQASQLPQTPPVLPATPVSQASQSAPASQESVDQTQRLPYSGQHQPLPQPQPQPGPASFQRNPGPAGESVDQTQRLAYPPSAQAAAQAGPSAGQQPSYQQQPSQESVDQTQRLAYPGSPAGPVGGPDQGEDPPDRTIAYLMEDTARDQALPQGRGHGPDQFQNQPFQQNQQYQPNNQPPAQPEAGPYGGPTPTPTLRFDQFPENTAPEQQQQAPQEEYRHFGPGVPGAAGGAPNQAAAVWRGEAAAPPPPKPKRRRAFAGWLLALAVLGIVLGILGYFYYFGTPVKVTGASVKGPTTTVGCGQTVTVTGTIQTNGDTGSVTYQWTRSDGGKSDVLTQHFTKGTHQATVSLLWTIKGQGDLKATATLDVLTPNSTTAATTFNYACTQ